MKDFFKKHTKLVAWAAFWVIFLLLALLIPSNNLKDATVAYWGGFAFINVAFILIGVVLFALQLNKTTIFSNTVVAYAVSGVYFAITFILNLIYMIVFKAENFAKEVFIPNIIIVILYVVAMLISNRGMKHMSAVTQHTEDMVQQNRMTTAKVNFILNSADAAADSVKAALRDLKEDVEYSDPMGVPATASIEAEFETMLDDIRKLVTNEASEDEILKAIKGAKNQLKYRNDVLKANK